MVMLLSVLVGIVAGWAAWKGLKPTRPMQEMLLLGATGGVLCGFAVDIAMTGERLLNNATINSIGAAMFGAFLFILLRRLLVEIR
jgi:uncharacterized membrane protein YeaQ/YmgE (transglycosylase-associated protein family)